MFGLDIAAFTAIEMAENGDSGHPNEIAFSSRNKAFQVEWERLVLYLSPSVTSLRSRSRCQ
jgi:hypothetical protein